MAKTASTCLSLHKELEQDVAQLVSSGSNHLKVWADVENSAQLLANALRVRDTPEDNHTVLGKTSLPEVLTRLLNLSLDDAPVPPEANTAALFELLRVAANLCMDHDGNRERLLDSGFPQGVVTLLEGYTESLPAPPYKVPSEMSTPHLKVIRTAIGVLLNASIGYDPVKTRLISMEAAMTILKLSAALYPPGSWLLSDLLSEGDKGDSAEELWSIRSGLANWSWRTVLELKDSQDESLQIFTPGPDVLPLLMQPLQIYLPSESMSPLFSADTPIFDSLIAADLESLEESCMLIESLTLDVKDVRLSLARGQDFPAEHSGVACLSAMLDFVEKGTYSPLWASADEAETGRREKTFDICKAAIIKAVVEVAGEESNEDVLWDDSDASMPGGEFVGRMVRWLKSYVASQDNAEDSVSATNRDDLAICASLSLGNLARRETHSTTLLSPPHNLAPILASPHLLSSSADMKIKHGVLGLLRHLAQCSLQSQTVQSALTGAGIVSRVCEIDIWNEKTDAMAEFVQMNAIAVVKHLCSASVVNTYAFVLPAASESTHATGLAQILVLVKRTNSVPVRSEGTRILVNVVKSLWSSDPSIASPIVPAGPTLANGPEDMNQQQQQRQDAMRAVLTPEYTSTLASLIGRSAKYPLLVNEGVVALSLLSMQKAGAPLVLAAITAPLPGDNAPNPVDIAPASASVDSTTSTSTDSPVSSPMVATPPHRPRLSVARHALDMLKFVLKNVDNPANFPVEIRLNVCSLLLQLTKNSAADASDLIKVKDFLRPTMTRLAENPQGMQSTDALSKASKKVLDAWA